MDLNVKALPNESPEDSLAYMLAYIAADEQRRTGERVTVSAMVRRMVRNEYQRRMKRNAAQAAKDGTK